MRALHAVEVVAHEQRFARAREIVEPVRLVALAGCRALEMRHKGLLRHGPELPQAGAAVQTHRCLLNLSGRRRVGRRVLSAAARATPGRNRSEGEREQLEHMVGRQHHGLALHHVAQVLHRLLQREP